MYPLHHFLANTQMNAKLFPVLLLLLIYSSCSDEDSSPEAKVQGTYESLLTGSSGSHEEKFDFYDTFELRSDGTFYREDVTRKVGLDEVLGFRTIANGTYTISDGIVSFHYENFYSKQIEDLPYFPKDQLNFSDSWDYPDHYRVLNNYTQLEYICPSNAMCGWLPNYTKID